MAVNAEKKRPLEMRSKNKEQHGTRSPEWRDITENGDRRWRAECVQQGLESSVNEEEWLVGSQMPATWRERGRIMMNFTCGVC